MIRKLKENDIDQVMRIWLDVNTQTHYFISEQYWLEQFNNIKQIIPQAEVYVYEKKDEILGFIGLSGNYIEGLFVSILAQSTGIGRQLLLFVKQIKKTLSLKVYQKNDRAIQFYLRENFIVQSKDIDKNTGEQEFLMKWRR